MGVRAIKIVGLTLGAVLIVTAGAAYAVRGHAMDHGGFGGPGWRGMHGGGMGWLKRADADKDGAVTVKELEDVRAERFGRFDRNTDGVVDKAEIEQAVRERVERMTQRLVRRFDKDRDGKVTKAEFDRFAKERFTWLDLNDDGKVSKDEMPPFMRHKMR
ncbi:MAG: EF-hand domain-containing protein [Hyphomicrobiales bacterium]|nr:EF-hand domain-containing protein [Hyphomicrobiales bacterium]